MLCEPAFTQSYFLATAAFTAATLQRLPSWQSSLPIIVIGGGGGCMTRFFSNQLRQPTTAVELCPGVVKVQIFKSDFLFDDRTRLPAHSAVASVSSPSRHLPSSLPHQAPHRLAACYSTALAPTAQLSAAMATNT